MALKTAQTRWRDVVLVCRKCSRKLDGGGFGPDGDKSLKKALRKYLKADKGKKAELVIKETDCFDVCPKKAVVAVNAANPKALLIVPAGADLFEVKARLGLDDDRRLKPSFRVVGDEGDKRRPQAQARPVNLRSPAFAILFSVSLIAAAGNMALQSVLPAIGREFGLRDTLVSAAFAISALMWTFASPYWARLSDTLGRKRVILIGLSGFVISMGGFGLAATSGLEHWLGAAVAFALMAVARTVYGVFGSAAPIASQAYVADRTSPEQRTQAMSLLASAQGLGTVIGPALAPFFVLPLVGLAGPMYAFALFGAVVLFVVWRRLPSGEVVRIPSPSGHRGDAGKGLWKDPRVRDYLLYGLLVTGAQAVNISVLGFHIIDELAVTGIEARAAQPFIGIAMLAGAAATLMAQWGLIPLLKLQPRDLMRWGAALALIGNVMSIASPGYYGVVIGYAVVSMGVGFARPGFTAGSSLSVGPHEQGAVAGLMMSLAGLSFLGPPVIGVALYEFSEPAPFVANALLLAGATLLCFVSARLRIGPADLPGRDETPSPETPPASQPGPEGNR